MLFTTCQKKTLFSQVHCYMSMCVLLASMTFLFIYDKSLDIFALLREAFSIIGTFLGKKWGEWRTHPCWLPKKYRQPAVEYQLILIFHIISPLQRCTYISIWPFLTSPSMGKHVVHFVRNSKALPWKVSSHCLKAKKGKWVSSFSCKNLQVRTLLDTTS